MNRAEFYDKVKEIVTEREKVHGSPQNVFGVIAGLWSTYLGVEISEENVAMMMVLLKVARSTCSVNNVDNLLDIAGYAACAADLQ